ncbi:MAG: iron chaperone [Crocinitomicaceae bacterium]
MAKKGAMPTYKTADDYIANQPEAAQKILQELRSVIQEAAPDAIELPNYKVPSYTLVEGGKSAQQIMMAGYAKNVSFYPFETTVAKFADELNDYKCGKGSIQFRFNEPLPKELIIRMVKFRKEELSTS